MKVLITGSSKFPVPAVRGGAVPNLIEQIIQQQEVEGELDLYCCSLWDKIAEEESNKYNKTEFIWAKVPKWIKSIDHTNTWVLKNIFKKDRLLSIGFLFQVIWFSFYIGKVIEKYNFDRVIFENSVPMLFSLKLFGNRTKYKNKYYIHMHSVPRKYYGNEKEFSNCRGLISVSKYVSGEILADQKVNIKKSQVKLMYNCIDTEMIQPRTREDIGIIKGKYNILEDEKIVMFAGRLCKEKGIEEVICMMRKISDPKVKLLVVGANFYSSGIVSPYEEHLKGLAEPIKDRIIFTGYVDYSKMSHLYSAADVVVLPSMWEEPAGMTIIEAMACNKPVITTISGGIPEYTGDNCILLEKNEELIDNLVVYTKRILDDETYSRKIANNGYNRAIQFNKLYYYKQLLNILDEE